MRRKPGTDMNFWRSLPEIRCLSQGLPTGYALTFVVSPRLLVRISHTPPGDVAQALVDASFDAMVADAAANRKWIVSVEVAVHRTEADVGIEFARHLDRKSTRLNSSHL